MKLPAIALRGSALEDYDQRIAFMAESIRNVDDANIVDPESLPALLRSAEPMDRIVGLARLAGQGQLSSDLDLSDLPPEVVLAAIDLAAAQFGAAAATALRKRWETDAGDAQALAGTAHNLLLEARLPYGGGAAALDDMIGANDPQAIVVGLQEFAVDSRLAGSVRSEALIRLRDFLDSDAYREHVRECAELAQEFGGDWTPRAVRLQSWLESEVDRTFFANALAAPAPGVLADLELLVRYGLRSGRISWDAQTAGFLRSALADLDETAWSGPDQLACRRLLRELADIQEP